MLVDTGNSFVAAATRDELRRWSGQRAEALTRLAEAASRGTITLLTATKDAAHSQAALLAEQLLAHAANRPWPDEAAGSGDEEDRPISCSACRGSGSSPTV